MIRAETDKRSPAIAEGRSRDGSLSVAAPGREPSRMDCPGVCVAQESDDGLTVRITYLHELGHYLGWDEEQTANVGLG
jgi:hypothetical protein